MKNPYIVPSLIISAAILAGFWMLKPSSEQPQKVVTVQPPKPQKVVIVQPTKPPDISIHDAALGGNIEAVKQHLAAGTDVNAKDGFDGSTPLHTAALAHYKEIAELLIAKGAGVNAKGMYGNTPLDLAIANKTGTADQTEIADLLRKHGGKTAEELAAPNKKLTDAAFNGDIITVKQCLAAGTDVDAKDKHGSTSLHLAAREGHKEIGLVGKEIVELLIANGADVNASSRHGTPLDVAIFNKHPETADLLRKHGAKTGAELKGGESVAEAAKPEPPTAEAPDILIHWAAYNGNIEAVKQHIAAGTDVNEMMETEGVYYGSAPLHLAVMYDHNTKEIAELLIAKGADVNAKDAEGKTPLDKTYFPEIAALLRKHGGKTAEELK